MTNRKELAILRQIEKLAIARLQEDWDPSDPQQLQCLCFQGNCGNPTSLYRTEAGYWICPECSGITFRVDSDEIESSKEEIDAGTIYRTAKGWRRKCADIVDLRGADAKTLRSTVEDFTPSVETVNEAALLMDLRQMRRANRSRNAQGRSKS